MSSKFVGRLIGGFLCSAILLSTAGVREALAADDTVKLLPPLSAAFAEVVPGEPDAEPYTLNPGDEILITDYSSADEKAPLTTRTTVLPDGTAVIYPVGLINVAGHTLKALNDLVNIKAGASPEQPEILVSLAKTRPVSVHVLGDVATPGIYTVEPGMLTSRVNSGFEVPNSNAQATMGSATTGGSVPGGSSAAIVQVPVVPPKQNQLTLLTALQLAGGVRDSGDINHIRITRAQTGRVFEVDLWNLLVRGDASQDIVLHDQDTVFVSRSKTIAAYDASQLGVAAQRARRVRVLGAVKRPGVYELNPTDDIFSALAMAGGFTDTAVTTQVILSRKSATGAIETTRVPLPHRGIFNNIRDKGENIARVPVSNGDVVVATNSALKIIGPKTTTFLISAATALLVAIAASGKF